jgi:hypothetical protein
MPTNAKQKKKSNRCHMVAIMTLLGSGNLLTSCLSYTQLRHSRSGENDDE